MAAIVISNDAMFISRISPVLENSGHHVIQYKWFLKALDNLLEIGPDIIVINAMEYPRHWKVLISHTAALYENSLLTIKPRFILFGNNEMSKKDIEHAKTLGVSGILNSTSEEGLEKLFSLLTDTEKENPNQLIFTNPITQRFVTGYVEKILNKTVTFIPEHKSQLEQLTQGTIIPKCLFLKDGVILKTKGQILTQKKDAPYTLQIYLE